MKILIVDDSRAMRKILRKALGRMGYTSAGIIEASDGVEALATLRADDVQIDIVLADWNMPNMDGLSFLRQLQGDERLRRIPVIMVTGEAEQNRVVEAIRAGARNYIVKPFTAEALRKKVLAIEMELIGCRKPTKTAVMRIEADRTSSARESSPAFIAELPEELVAGIYERARMIEHSAGDVLIEPQEIVEWLHIVEKGEVESLEGDGDRREEVRGRGECIGELSFLSGDPAGLTARARTDVVIASVGKDDFENLLAEYPHLSFYLTKLLTIRTSSADATDADACLSGKLSMMALAEVVQRLHTARRTGILNVQSGDDDGEIYFQDGYVRHATAGDAGGEEAFYQLMTWSEGRFAFEEADPTIQPGIFRATASLLMEGMRRQDELRKMRA